MITRLMLGTGAAVLAVQTPVFAADGPPPPPPPGMNHRMMAPPAPMTKADAQKRVVELFAEVDANKDNAITLDEIDKAHDKRRVEMRAAMDKRRQEARDRAFAMLDTDKNGSISRAEFDAVARGPMPRLAMTGDGPPPPPPVADGRDVSPPPPPPPGAMGMRRMIMFRHAGGPGMMGGPGMDRPGLGLLSDRWFARADANHDGKVTLNEAKAAADKLFDRVDTDHDGTISPEERRMTFRMRMRHGPMGWNRAEG